MTPEKLCIFCKHMEIVDTRGMGSTWTGPYGAKGASCRKGHFDHYDTENVDDLVEYRALILKAMKCPDYEEIQVDDEGNLIK